jgi:hypothetical protein
LLNVNPFSKQKTEKRKKEFKLEKQIKSITPSVGSLAKVFKSNQDIFEAMKHKKSAPIKNGVLMKRINFHLRQLENETHSNFKVLETEPMARRHSPSIRIETKSRSDTPSSNMSVSSVKTEKANHF